MAEHEIAIVRSRGQITLPTSLRRAAGINEGDPIEMVTTDEGILLRPKKFIDASQAWFWTDDWQAGERQATAEIKARRGTTYVSDKAFLASLEDKPPPRRKRTPPRRAR